MGDFLDGYYVFDNDFNAVLHGVRGLGPIFGLSSSGVAAAQQISVSSGSVAGLYGGTQYAYNVATFSLISFTPDATYPLKGIIYATASSATAAAISAVWGTASSAVPAGLSAKYTREPIPPNIPTNSVLLAEIWVPANAANGAECTIFNYDLRPNGGSYATTE